MPAWRIRRWIKSAELKAIKASDACTTAPGTRRRLTTLERLFKPAFIAALDQAGRRNAANIAARASYRSADGKFNSTV
jgi:hypothetical protein